MNSSLAKEGKKVKAEAGKLKALLAALKKLWSKELLWSLLVLLICIPIALIISYIIGHYASEDIKEIFKIIAGEYPRFTVLYVMSIVGIYFLRIVITAIKTQLGKKKQE